MRAACRKFLNKVGDEGGDIVRNAFRQGHWASWVFLGALGKMRGIFGVHLTKIAAQHKLDIEDDLASILRIGDKGNQDNDPSSRTRKLGSTTQRSEQKKKPGRLSKSR